MPRVGVVLAVLAAALAALSAPASAQTAVVDADILSVGFPFSRSLVHTIKIGRWYPIRVQLRLVGGDHTEVRLAAEQLDLDGDRVRYVRDDVPLTAGAVKDVWCYAVRSVDRDSLEETVDIIDPASGTRLKTINVPPYDIAHSDVSLVLDISRDGDTCERLGTLADSGEISSFGVGERNCYRKMYIGRIAADELPDRWIGLEAVDVVVWNLPDPSPNGLGRSQLDALIEWVRNGGQLVLGVGSQAALVKDSPLRDILPVELTGQTSAPSSLPAFEREFYRVSRENSDSSMAFAISRLRPGAIEARSERVGGSSLPLIATHNVGSGRVTFCATSLRDLFGPTVQPKAMSLVVNFNPLTTKYVENEGNNNQFGDFETGQIQDEIVSVVGFVETGTIKSLIATLFVAGYIAVATLVSWFWLKATKRTVLSWPVFGAIAVGMSVLSLLAVSLSRGITGDVKSLCIVDMEAGASYGRGPCWFGYASVDRSDRDLTLPTIQGDGSEDQSLNYLRPMTPLAALSSYATPDRYSADAMHAELIDAPSRASLKQFEGHWQGDVGGTIRANIAVSRSSGEITSASWIVNELPGVQISGGYLLYLDPRLPGGAPVSVSCLTRCARPELNKLGEVPAAVNVLVAPIRGIAANGELRGVGDAAQYGKLRDDQARWDARYGESGDRSKRPDLRTLRQYQNETWSATGGARGFEDAVMLASTIELCLPGTGFTRFDTASRNIFTRGLVDCDVTHWLTRGQGVLVLFAEEPGPAHLHRDGREFEASEGRTCYRVRVPITYQG